MPCYICRTNTGPFQRLEVARLHFIRKAHPNFKANSYLCPKCFKQFERIYRMKPKGQSSNSSQVSLESKSLRSPESSKNSTSSGVTTIQKSKTQQNESSSKTTDSESQENINSHTTSELVFHFDSRSPNDSADSTDRIVRLEPQFRSIQDSTRKTSKNPELTAARYGAEKAVENANRRQGYLSRIENLSSEQSSIGKSRRRKADDGGDNSSSSLDNTINSEPERVIRMDPNFLVPRLASPAKKPTPVTEKPKTPPRKPKTPPRKPGPASRKRPRHITGDASDDTDEDDSPPQLSPNNLAHTRPIARRRIFFFSFDFFFF